MTKELKVKYSVLPARIVHEKQFKLAHYNVMVSLCISAGKSGLVYKTVETIGHECPHVKRESIKKHSMIWLSGVLVPIREKIHEESNQ